MADRTSGPRERQPSRSVDLSQRAHRSEARRSERPGEPIRRRSRLVSWRRRHLNARAIVALIVLVSLLAAEVAAIIAPAA